MKKNQETKHLFNLIKSYKGTFMLGGILSLLLSGIYIGQAFYIKIIADSVLKQHSKITIEAIIILIILFVGGSIITYLSTYIKRYFSDKLHYDLRIKAFEKIAFGNMPELSKRKSGDMVSIFNTEMQTLQSFVQNQLFNFIVQPTLFMSSTIILLCISWKLFLGCFAFLPIVFYFINFFSKKIGESYGAFFPQQGEANSKVKELITGISTIKANNMEEVYTQKCEEMYSTCYKTKKRIEKFDALIMPFVIALNELPYLLIIYGGYLILKGEMNIGSLLLFLQLTRYIIDPLTEVHHMLNSARTSSKAYKRILEIVNIQREKASDGCIHDHSIKNIVELRGVSFKYDKNNDYVLRNVHLEVKKGQLVTIIGPSGSGKSTIINLICGFYMPDEGEIYLLGNKITDQTKTLAREYIAYISQDSIIFPGTILYNIRYGQLNATQDQVIEVAKEVNLHEAIMKLPQGYDTYVNENGIGLSTGQKQKIAIARALIKKAPIILMDEITSSLDGESEDLIYKTIEKLLKSGHTVINISHHLTTLSKENQLFKLENNSIIECAN